MEKVVSCIFQYLFNQIVNKLSESGSLQCTFKKLNFSQPNPAQTRGEPGWHTGWNPH